MGFFKELDEAKNDVKIQRKKRKTLGDASNKPEVMRRSSRERRQVSYNCRDDDDFLMPWKPSFKSKVRGKENLGSSPSTSSANSSSKEVPQERSLRPRKQVSYDEDIVPPHDGYIWCSTCKEQKFNGCEEHVPRFADWSDFCLRIEPSCAARNSGEGVVNRGTTIDEGTVFGPYVGKFWTKAEYKVGHKFTIFLFY